MGVQFIKITDSAYVASAGLGAYEATSTDDKFIVYDTISNINGNIYHSRTKNGSVNWWNGSGDIDTNVKSILVTSSDNSKGTVSGTTTFGYTKNNSEQMVTITSVCTPKNIDEYEFGNYSSSVGSMSGKILTIPAKAESDINVVANWKEVVVLNRFTLDSSATTFTVIGR